MEYQGEEYRCEEYRDEEYRDEEYRGEDYQGDRRPLLMAQASTAQIHGTPCYSGGAGA